VTLSTFAELPGLRNDRPPKVPTPPWRAVSKHCSQLVLPGWPNGPEVLGSPLPPATAEQESEPDG
jgi:hypothetical protein